MSGALLLRILLAPLLALVLLFLYLTVDARIRGWRRIASRFRAPADLPSDLGRQYLEVGTGGVIAFASMCLAAAREDGLWLAPPRALRWTHPPLLVPWDQLAVRDAHTRLGSRLLRLSVGRIHLGFITLRGGVAADVLQHLTR